MFCSLVPQNLFHVHMFLDCEYSRLSSLPAGLAFRERVVVVAEASERRLYSQATMFPHMKLAMFPFSL